MNAATALPERGSTLRQHYQLFRALDGDESADVFLARDLSDDAPVRIRLIRPAALPSAAARAQAMRTIAAAIEWRHPRALPIREVGVDADRLYVVTERPRGAPLRERLIGPQQATIESRLMWATGIVDQALEVVEAAVLAGISHPGLTPDNVFVTPYGEIELGDVGMPALPAVSALPSAEVPTAAFVRPLEQATGRTALVVEQVYAAAALIMWMVSGAPPFPGASLEQVARRHRSKRAPSLLNYAPEAPEELAAIIARCLRKDPAGRPQTISAMRAILVPVANASALGPKNWSPEDGSADGVDQQAANRHASGAFSAVTASLRAFGFAARSAVSKMPGVHIRAAESESAA